MIRFEEPAIKIIKFDTPDILTLSFYNAFGNDNNSYVNEDNYQMEENPWM